MHDEDLPSLPDAQRLHDLCIVDAELAAEEPDIRLATAQQRQGGRRPDVLDRPGRPGCSSANAAVSRWAMGTALSDTATM